MAVIVPELHLPSVFVSTLDQFFIDSIVDSEPVFSKIRIEIFAEWQGFKSLSKCESAFPAISAVIKSLYGIVGILMCGDLPFKFVSSLSNDLFVCPVYMGCRTYAVTKTTAYLYAISIDIEHRVWRQVRISNH